MRNLCSFPHRFRLVCGPAAAEIGATGGWLCRGLTMKAQPASSWICLRNTGREAEVKVVERLDRREAGDMGEHLAGAGPMRVTLGAQGRSTCNSTLAGRPRYYPNSLAALHCGLAQKLHHERER